MCWMRGDIHEAASNIEYQPGTNSLRNANTYLLELCFETVDGTRRSLCLCASENLNWKGRS
jgi:hypothetical protein